MSARFLLYGNYDVTDSLVILEKHLRADAKMIIYKSVYTREGEGRWRICIGRIYDSIFNRDNTEMRRK